MTLRAWPPSPPRPWNRPHERRTPAPHRRLEVLTIVKRRGSLGLLSHGDREDVFTRSRTELRARFKIVDTIEAETAAVETEAELTVLAGVAGIQVP